MTRVAPSRYFPPAEMADDHGLVCVGGALSPEMLLDAYAHGIFPWPLIPGVQLPQWWSPDPRAIFELDGLHVSRRLKQTLRSGKFAVTINRNFPSVIKGCASVGDRRGNTWLTPEMIDAYIRLHRLGYAHSVEVWVGPLAANILAGGVYGVAVGGFFAAESMFHRTSDASKVALVHLFDRLNARGYQLLDIQQLTDHTARLGAIEIPRREYLRRLAAAVALPVAFDGPTP